MTVEVSLGFTCIGVLALLNLSVKKVNIDSCSGLQTEATHTSTLNVVAHGDLSLFFFMFCHEDSSGWDSGHSNGFVNGIHENRTNRGFGGRGTPRNDRGGSGAWVCQRGGCSLTHPIQNACGDNP